MMRHAPRGRPPFAVMALLMVTTSCAPSTGNNADSVLEKISRNSALTIGIRFDQPGLSERTLNGRFAGFDVDVAKYIAHELGVSDEDIMWQEATPANRETELTSKSADMIVATYSITEERKNEVSFAGPYFETGQSLLVRLSSTDIAGPESLNNKKLCSTAGSTPAQQVKDRFAKGVELVEYPRYPDCVTALLAGQVDAVTTDAVILAGYVVENPELLKVVGTPFSTERYGVGLHKDDNEGKAAVNAAIDKMVKSGAWHESLTRNIGPSGYAVPPPPPITEK